MHVHVEAIRHLHLRGVLVGEFRADEGRAGVGGVDVDPDVRVAAEDGGEGFEVVDGAGGGGAEGEGDVVGFEALGGAGVKGGLEVGPGEGEVVFVGGGDGAEAGAGDAGALGGGRVGLVGGQGDEFAAQRCDLFFPFRGVGGEVGGFAAAVDVAFAGGDHACDDGFGGGALDGAAAALGGGGEE